MFFFLVQPCRDALPLRNNDGMAGVGCSPAPRQDPSQAVALSPSAAGCKVAEPRPDYPGLAALSSPRPLLFIVRRAVRLRCRYRQPRFCAARSPARLPLRKKEEIISWQSPEKWEGRTRDLYAHPCTALPPVSIPGTSRPEAAPPLLSQKRSGLISLNA